MLLLRPPVQIAGTALLEPRMNRRIAKPDRPFRRFAFLRRHGISFPGGLANITISDYISSLNGILLDQNVYIRNRAPEGIAGPHVALNAPSAEQNGLGALPVSALREQAFNRRPDAVPPSFNHHSTVVTP